MKLSEKTNESPIKRLYKTLTKENLWLYVLSLLSKKEAHGYTIAEDISKKFGWEPGFITPYIVLYRLESEGYIKSKNVGRRVNYKITKKGMDTLSKAKRILKAISEEL